jgi:mono/diheme cytochrome c family protein
MVLATPTLRMFGALAFLLATGVAAAEAGDVTNGRAIAERWCSNCHQTDSRRVAQDFAPPLRVVAGRSYATEKWLKSWIADPHPPMPNLNLTQAQIDDVVSYLKTLRTGR